MTKFDTDVVVANEAGQEAAKAFKRLLAMKKTKEPVGKPEIKLPTTVEMLLQQGKSLTRAYEGWKSEFEAPSDKKLYQLLGDVCAYIESIEQLRASEKEKMLEMIRKDINSRTQSPTVNAQTSIESLVVKFVFNGLIRQTAYNYSKALEICRKDGVKAAGVAHYLETSRGIINPISAHSESATPSSVKAAGDTKERVSMMREMYSLQAKGGALIDFKGAVFNCYDVEKAVKAKKEGKHDPKKTKGSFVFFVAVPTADEAKYQLVQGSVFDQAFENSLIYQMSSEFQSLELGELKAALDGMKAEDGFDDMRQELMEEAEF